MAKIVSRKAHLRRTRSGVSVVKKTTVLYTKNKRPYIKLPTGRAKFISKEDVKKYE